MTELWGWVIGALAAVCATLFATADSALRDQPNSLSIGLMKTPNAARRPDADIMHTVSAPSTTQAG